jgi:hypothetical protein
MLPVALYIIVGMGLGLVATVANKPPRVDDHKDAEIEAEIAEAITTDSASIRGWWYSPPKKKDEEGEYIPSIKRVVPSKLLLDGSRRSIDGVIVYRVIDDSITGNSKSTSPSLPFYVSKKTYESLKRICKNNCIL